MNGIMEIVVAEVIEFYIPKNFRTPHKWAPQLEPGKIIEFCLPAKEDQPVLIYIG